MPNVASLVGALQETKLAAHGIDSKALHGVPQSYQDEKSKQQVEDVERGVVHDFAMDEKRGFVQFEVLPRYEQLTRPEPRIATENAEPQPGLQPSVTQVMILEYLEPFRQSVLAYRQGACGAKCDAKRAAKNFVKDLYNQERARRRAVNGQLECGARKEIKRELKPVKQMLKAAVKEVKRERCGGCC